MHAITESNEVDNDLNQLPPNTYVFTEIAYKLSPFQICKIPYSFSFLFSCLVIYLTRCYRCKSEESGHIDESSDWFVKRRIKYAMMVA